MASRKKLALSEEDILARKVSDFFFNLRRSTKIKKKKRGVRHRMAEPRNVFPDGMNARKSAPRLRKTRKKKKPGVKKDRVLVKQDPVHSGPRYNISFQEVWRAYGRMRKGRGFYPSNKVLWKNRHALVLGCSNFYGKPDPIVPTTGKKFPSDYTGDGPVPRISLSGRNKYQTNHESKENRLIVDKIRIGSPIQNLKKSRSSNGRGGHTQQEQPTVPEIDFSKILQNTAHRRKSVKLMSSTSPQVPHTHGRMQRRYSGARRNVLVDSSDCTTDSVLWEYMCKVGKTPPDRALLKIISDYDHRDRTQELEKSINHLEELINEGNDRPMILQLWKKTLKSKKNRLVDHQEVVPGTPESSDDEDEEDDEHDSIFCAVESQEFSPMVPPNQRNNHKLNYTYLQQQHMIPQKLIASVKPHAKSRNSNGWVSAPNKSS